MGEVTPRASSRTAGLRGRISAYRGNWVEPLVGRTCSRIVFDRYSPPLVIWFLADGPDAHLQIDSPLHLQIGMQTLRLDPVGPDKPRTTLGPLLALIGRTVTVAVARADGGLRLEFDGGVAVDVDCPDPDIESWWFHLDDESEDWTPAP